jgi:lysozyme family protein
MVHMGTLRDYEKGEGKDWNVKGSIAYGKGQVHEDFKGLQQDLNRFASQVGFPKLQVDGFLGDETVAAWRKTYDTALKKDPLATIEILPIVSKEQLATVCQRVRHWLQTTGVKVLGNQAQA